MNTMKEEALRAASKCHLCGKPFTHAGHILFYRVTIERFGLKLDNIRRQDGLSLMLGNSRLANIMGTDADMAQAVMEPMTVTVCEPCSLDPHAVPLAAMVHA